MNLYSTIIRPLVTEKSTHQSSQTEEGRSSVYAFEVRQGATKPEIKDAVQMVYGVKVVAVRTQNRLGKRRRYRMRVGRTRETKRAYVVLHPDHHIELY